MSGFANSHVEKIVAVGTANSRFKNLELKDIDSRPSANVEFVYCSGIEAWTIVDLRRALSAILRILKPGGVVRVAAQDLDAVVHGYLLDWKRDQPADMTRAERLNAWRKNETAQYVFNEEDLRAELENAGFVDIWRLPAGASSIEVFRDCERDETKGLVLEGRNPVVTK
jgi:predicted SAM-dependent methyltransferase